MTRCLAVFIVALGLGLFATTSRAQTYKPCFDDPVFEEAAFAQPNFEEPEFEPGKRIPVQIEKPEFEKQIREKAEFERSIIVNPEFVRIEFDNGCTKPTSKPAALQRLDWLGASYRPQKSSLMQPLTAKTTSTVKNVKATKTADASLLTKLKAAKSQSRLVAVNKLR